MFGRLKALVAGVAIGGASMFVAQQYHMVRYDDGVFFVKRTTTTDLKTAYVDVRKWGMSEWGQHPQVASALTRDGYGALVMATTANKVKETITKPFADLKIEFEDEQPESGASSPFDWGAAIAGPQTSAPPPRRPQQPQTGGAARGGWMVEPPLVEATSAGRSSKPEPTGETQGLLQRLLNEASSRLLPGESADQTSTDASPTDQQQASTTALKPSGELIDDALAEDAALPKGPVADSQQLDVQQVAATKAREVADAVAEELAGEIPDDLLPGVEALSRAGPSRQRSRATLDASEADTVDEAAGQVDDRFGFLKDLFADIVPEPDAPRHHDPATGSAAESLVSGSGWIAVPDETPQRSEVPPLPRRRPLPRAQRLILTEPF
ncbi:hypothetical protein Mal4_26800 [Maioricimonas rarisocia]|uniref:Uncharacterized protein n=1 Tax=Maioricimonas rarisocia TaxID=2528026 RepID=A0A517Z7A0_9PLAN|nr:hypothetical protein [Maioricimonas rarisocia]QDU38353.1 hypothetical protein Mal4_26800 [Maioricimonas rarisocia]